MTQIHYLDNAATTPVLPAAAQAVGAAMERWGNPSAQYGLGRDAARELEEHRRTVAGALACQPEEVVFTSGGTESDNWAVTRGAGRRGGHIITTAVEHSAVLEPVKALAGRGFDVTYLPVDRSGHVSAEDFKAALREDTVLCSMMLVNNELGSVQPVAECAKAAKAFKKDIFFHCDGVQGFLKIPFTPRELGVDALSVSGHKIGAPKGIGCMYLKKGVKLPPLILGGGQEGGLRSGTEPMPMIAAFSAAVAEGAQEQKAEIERLTALRDYAAKALQENVADLKILSPGDAPHILAVTLPGYKSEVVVRFLSDLGVYISSGSACHKGKPSHVYAALGLPKPWLDGALRLSFSPDSTREEADALVAALKDAAGSLFTTLS